MAYDSEDDEADDIARPLYIHLVQLHYVRAHSELSSLTHELELLAHSMKMSELPSARQSQHQQQQQESRERARGSADAEDITWRLENVQGLGSRESPLLDPQGKVSFTGPWQNSLCFLSIVLEDMTDAHAAYRVFPLCLTRI